MRLLSTDKLVAIAAPNMSQSDLLYSIEKTLKPSSHLPDCVEEMYTRMADPQRFQVALAAGEHLVNIYKHNCEDMSKQNPLKQQHIILKCVKKISMNY